MALPQTLLGRTGVSVTRLGLGGEGVLRTYGREREAEALIAAALDAGITYFESARAYSGSEAYLGRGLKGRRREIFLTSKSHGRTYKEALAHLSITLRNLDTDYLDLWQVHDLRTLEEVEALGRKGGALKAFLQAKKKGWARFIGVTGHEDPAVLRRALELYPFDTVLLPINPAEPHHQSFLPLAAEAREKFQVGVIGMKVLCRGFLPRVLGRVKDFIAYALSQPAQVVVGMDNIFQLRELTAAVQDFEPLSSEAQRALEADTASYARRLMYYKP
jgi:aryl-alcohol dehydrogenase-like predicted oxidoreductase